MQEKSQGDSTQYPAETLLSSLTSLQKKSGDRRGICRTSCATSLLLAGGALVLGAQLSKVSESENSHPAVV